MRYDLVIIGGGPGGYVPAIRSAQYGLRTALVEMGELGGTCLNRGCVPTKALLHAAGLINQTLDFQSFGITADNVSIDLKKIYEKKDETVAGMREGIARLLKSNGVDILRGRAFLPKQGIVEVKLEDKTQTLRAENVLIATGSAAKKPPILGIDSPGVVFSDDLLLSPLDFESLIIIGAGAVGVEFALALAAFGIKVTLLESMERILPAMDKEISQNLSMIMKKRGVQVVSGVLVKEIVKSNNALRCVYEKNGAEQSVPAERVFAAVGRSPMFDGLFDKSLGIKTGRGIVVDENFETSVKGIYAAGDVLENSRQLAHAASAEGVCAVMHIAKKPFCTDLFTVPSCIYTDPEIAAVGMTADEAKQSGIAARTGKCLMGGNARSVIEGAGRGFIKLVFNNADDKLIGAHIMCPGATDIIGFLSAAITMGLTSKKLASFVFAHPTFMEGVAEAADNSNGQAIHAVPRKV